MNVGRRNALVLAGAMTSVAALAALARPPRPEAGRASTVSLDAMFPRSFGDWRVDPLSVAFVRPADRQGKLYQIYDQVLERSYVDPRGQRMMLSVAFGSEQSSSLQMHRPEVCYRSAGYSIHDVRSGLLVLGITRIAVTRLRAALPDRPEPITYWSVLGGSVVADAAAGRRRRIAAVMNHEVLDGMLVRISSIDEDSTHAHAAQARFAGELVAALTPSDRARIVGAHPEG